MRGRWAQLCAAGWQQTALMIELILHNSWASKYCQIVENKWVSLPWPNAVHNQGDYLNPEQHTQQPAGCSRAHTYVAKHQNSSARQVLQLQWPGHSLGIPELPQWPLPEGLFPPNPPVRADPSGVWVWQRQVSTSAAAFTPAPAQWKVHLLPSPVT